MNKMIMLPQLRTKLIICRKEARHWDFFTNRFIKFDMQTHIDCFTRYKDFEPGMVTGTL